MASGEDVYCTLVLTDSYLPGAAVLAHSLRDAGTTKKLACLIVQDSLRPSTVTELQSLYNYVIPIERIGNPQPANLYLMNRPDLLYTFTKIHLWRLTQYRKIIYIDADVVALRAPDELFAVEESFAAAPDVGWPDAFNTGVMVLSPHMGDYHALRTLAGAGDSFDGADQGLLNQYFEHKPWKRLSFTYNCTPSGHYQYEPAYRYYKRDISLVHYIGRDKPWVRGRAPQSAPSSYQELTSRWWAVYDRHFHISTDDYIATAQHSPPPRPIQQQVNEGQHQRTAYYATGYPVATTQPAPPPEVPAISTDHVFTDPVDKLEGISQGHIEPTPTVQQRKFSAPQMQWDATRAAPPPRSEPEAVNFPTTIYEFTTDPNPFKPPQAYPDPPTDMWYEVPKEKPKQQEKPKPIFPWEERVGSKPSRKFLDDEPLPPAVEGSPELDANLIDEFEVTTDNVPEPVTPTIRLNNSSVPWQDFGALNKNAWDEVSGIDQYVRALTAFQRNRGNVQVVSSKPSPPTQIASPPTETSVTDVIDQARQRRESLILTDFPTAVERPSLPVTPAPRRRRTMWGTDEEAEVEMPEAEGVPDQIDWVCPKCGVFLQLCLAGPLHKDPTAQLEQLRKNSLIGPDDLQLPTKRALPLRTLPATSVPSLHESEAALSAGPEQPLFTSSANLDTFHKKGYADGNHAVSPAAISPGSSEAKKGVDEGPLLKDPVFVVPETSPLPGVASDIVDDGLISPKTTR